MEVKEHPPDIDAEIQLPPGPIIDAEMETEA